MAKRLTLLLGLGFLLVLSCNHKKKSTEIDLDEYEISQGIVVHLTYNKDVPKGPRHPNIYCIYDLDTEKPRKGYLKRTSRVFSLDEPVVVLVNKKDRSVSYIEGSMSYDKELLEWYRKKSEEVPEKYYRVEDENWASYRN